MFHLSLNSLCSGEGGVFGGRGSWVWTQIPTFDPESKFAKIQTSLCQPTRSGWVVCNTVLAAQTVMGSSPRPNLHQCLWTCLQVSGSKNLGCHGDLYTVSRCCTRGESEDHTGEKARKKDPPWLWNIGQTSPEVQNRGISGPMKRTYVLPKILYVSVVQTQLPTFDPESKSAKINNSLCKCGGWVGKWSLTMWDIWWEFGVNYNILTTKFSTKPERVHHR